MVLGGNGGGKGSLWWRLLRELGRRVALDGGSRLVRCRV